MGKKKPSEISLVPGLLEMRNGMKYSGCGSGSGCGCGCHFD